MGGNGSYAVAALKVLKAMPDIDPNRVFLQGYSFGAISSLFATDTKTPGTHDTKIAGLIAYYPYCYENVEFSAPTIVLIGEKDDCMVACSALPSRTKGSPIFRKSRRLSRRLPRIQLADGPTRSTISDITSPSTQRARSTRNKQPTPLWPNT